MNSEPSHIQYICNHKVEFIDYFLPKYIKDVSNMNYHDDKVLYVVGHVKPMHWLSHSRRSHYMIPFPKFLFWRNNRQLINFAGGAK